MVCSEGQHTVQADVEAEFWKAQGRNNFRKKPVYGSGTDGNVDMKVKISLQTSSGIRAMTQTRHAREFVRSYMHRQNSYSSSKVAGVIR